MTLSISKDAQCNNINLYDSDELLDYYNNSSNQTIELGITCNCGTETIKEVQLSDVQYDSDLDLAFITIDRDFINGTDDDTDPLEDGIYRLRLIHTNTVTSTVTSEFLCVAIICEIKCTAINYLAGDLDSNIWAYLLALENTHICDKCECEASCVIYNELKDIINNDTSGNCSQC
jgi:hypothetical protein